MALEGSGPCKRAFQLDDWHQFLLQESHCHIHSLSFMGLQHLDGLPPICDQLKKENTHYKDERQRYWHKLQKKETTKFFFRINE